MKKRIVTSLAVAMLMMASLPMAVSAHGHNGSGGCSQTSYGLCTVEDCNMAGTHQHGGTYYSGHTLGDGHDYHQACTVQDCTKTANHEHDGVTCFPHNNSDGHNYHSSGNRGSRRHH